MGTGTSYRHHAVEGSYDAIVIGSGMAIAGVTLLIIASGRFVLEVLAG